ncbi:MAG: sigma-70 family RNA polymerase sigma factor [Myxococcales bacterium]|nr:sigma-70 family RNA polymerase sigma factor [Myxococcales bacterium]
MSDFEDHRTALFAQAYRMLGDRARAEELVQETWLRWSTAPRIRSPRAWGMRVITNLCLNELGSARHRREEARGTRLPDLIDTEASDPWVRAEEVSLALLVLLQRLPPPERAVLLLHDVCGFTHAEVARMLGRSEASSRKLLQRGRRHVAVQGVPHPASGEEHAQLLAAFVEASSAGDVQRLVSLLAPDATLIVDAGDTGTEFGGVRNLPRPLVGAERVAAFTAHVTPRGLSELTMEHRELNGRPAILTRKAGAPSAAVSVVVVRGRIAWVLIQADPTRLADLA